jgi:hypothetical protein
MIKRALDARLVEPTANPAEPQEFLFIRLALTRNGFSNLAAGAESGDSPLRFACPSRINGVSSKLTFNVLRSHGVFGNASA